MGSLVERPTLGEAMPPHSAMVERFEIVLPFVATADNLADFLTKPMKNATHMATQFHTLCRIIMNDHADAAQSHRRLAAAPPCAEGGRPRAPALSRLTALGDVPLSGTCVIMVVGNLVAL